MRPPVDCLGMALTTFFAQVACSDLGTSKAWFETIFDRPFDAAPMDGLVEWHHGDSAGLQLFRQPDNAGHTTLTLLVDDLSGERDRLTDAGMQVGEIERADTVDIVRMDDPDGNLVVLAQPRS